MSTFHRPPFFVLGSVRSGTTMLRQILERHPALVCPEETHLFRWPYPYGTPDFQKISTTNRTLKRHREIDGIGEDEFEAMLDASLTRRELIERYMEAYAARRKPEATRWFEKSPQNVYGIQLIHGLFPEARFLHIVRHPLDVVSSLKLGKVMKVPSIVGAANYWMEAVSAIRSFSESRPDVVWEVRYEDFTAEPHRQLKDLLTFLDEPFDDRILTDFSVSASSHCSGGILSEGEIAKAWAICGEVAARFNYGPWTPVAEPDKPAPHATSSASEPLPVEEISDLSGTDEPAARESQAAGAA